MMCPSLFPGPRPGELLYSALARHAVLRGSAGPKAVMRELFGHPSAIATVDLPNRLVALSERLPGCSDRGVGELIYRHTLASYYTTFQPPATIARARAAMAGAAGSVHLVLGVSTFRTGRPPALRFCPECLMAMSARWGTWHWRRDHQLPGVLVCPEHGVRLRESTVRLAAVNRHRFAAATRETCPVGAAPATDLMDPATGGLLLELARASASLLETRPDGIEAATLVDGYRAELRRAGLMKGWFKADQAGLARRFSAHWGRVLDRLEGVDLSATTETWLASLVRSGSSVQPPLQHLLLRLFLEAQADVAVARPQRPYVERRRPECLGSRHGRPPRPALLDWAKIDVDYAMRIRREAQAVARESPPRRVTVRTVEARLGRRDWLSKRKAKLPLSVAAAAYVSETVERFQTRRLHWHVGRAVALGECDPWVVLRNAGLPAHLIDAVRREIEVAARARRYA